MNYAIILSGGTGSRTGADTPKQYIKNNGHMMITYALRNIISCDFVDSIYIVADTMWQQDIIDDADSLYLSDDKIGGFALPGDNRQLSILHGMQKVIDDIKVSSADSDIRSNDSVLIHDAARPYVTKDLLNRCYNSFNGHDAVMPALPMKDTVYLSDDNKVISALLDRDKVYAGQAPELFNLQKYYDANMALMPDKILTINGSSEPAVLRGMDVAIIPGEESNTKVTTNEDLKFYTRQNFKAGAGA